MASLLNRILGVSDDPADTAVNDQGYTNNNQVQGGWAGLAGLGAALGQIFSPSVDKSAGYAALGGVPASIQKYEKGAGDMRNTAANTLHTGSETALNKNTLDIKQKVQGWMASHPGASVEEAVRATAGITGDYSQPLTMRGQDITQKDAALKNDLERQRLAIEQNKLVPVGDGTFVAQDGRGGWRTVDPEVLQQGGGAAPPQVGAPPQIQPAMPGQTPIPQGPIQPANIQQPGQPPVAPQQGATPPATQPAVRLVTTDGKPIQGINYDALAKLNPREQQLVVGMITGQTGNPYSARNGLKAGLEAKAMAVDPTYSDSAFNARNTYAKDDANPNGKVGQARLAANGFINQVQPLIGLHDKLDMADAPEGGLRGIGAGIYNAAKNKVQGWDQNPDLAALHAAIPELTAQYAKIATGGGQTGEMERQQWEGRLRAAQTNTAFNAVVAQMGQEVQRKLQVMEEDRSRVLGPHAGSILAPAAKQTLDQIGQYNRHNAGGGEAKQSAGPVAIGKTQDGRTVFKDPDGVQRVR